jgi:hypothetical protein
MMNENIENKNDGLRKKLKNIGKDYKGWTPLAYGGLSALTAYVGGLVTVSAKDIYNYALTELPKVPKYISENPNIADLLHKSLVQIYSSIIAVNGIAQDYAVAGFVGGIILVGQTKGFLRKRLGGE